jgi:hypothetical protein
MCRFEVSLKASLSRLVKELKKLFFRCIIFQAIRGLGQSVGRRRELLQYCRDWSVRSDFERTVKFCLYSWEKHSPWLLTPYLGLECKC